MRLALVRQRWSALGGAENTLLALTRELLRQGHEVTLVTAEPQPPPALASLANLHWRPAPVWPGKLGRVLGFAVNTRRVLQQGRFDVIFSLERTLQQDAYRAGDGCHREWLARRRPYDSRPERLHLALSPFHRTLLSLEKRLFQDPGLKLVIANSRQVPAEVRRHYQVDPGKIRVIYNGVDRERFSPQRLAALPAGPLAAWAWNRGYPPSSLWAPGLNAKACTFSSPPWPGCGAGTAGCWWSVTAGPRPINVWPKTGGGPPGPVPGPPTPGGTILCRGPGTGPAHHL